MRECGKNVPNSIQMFKSEAEIMSLFRIYDKEIWDRHRDNYDVIRTKKIFANNVEIELSSDIFLLDDVIIICGRSHHLSSILIRHLRKKNVVKIELLDNTEKKGAALVITLRKQNILKSVVTLLTPENVECFDSSSDYVLLTVPIMNSDDVSIRRIKQRLSTFFQLNNDNTDLETTNLITVPLSIINFSTLGKCITPFKLKAVSYTSNEAGRREFIVFMRNIFSTKKSDLKLKGFLSTMKKSKSHFNPPFQNYFSIIKNESIFEDYLTTKIFKTKNVETDETYDVTGRAFGSLFGDEWLHCDIIDSYLNEWRKRVGDVISNPSNGGETRVKIFNTLLYTRLTRGVVIDSLKALPKSKFLRIQENAKRIAKEKVYRLSKVCTSIFDFDILIIPIHIDDHWMTGIIYQPRNCLTEIKENDDNSMEIDDDTHSSVFVFDSLATNFTPNKHLCTAILKEYVGACFSSLKEKFLGKDWLFEKDKIRTVRLKCPYQQRNSHDCGLYMLEFIRQIMVNPGSLELLVRSEPMVEVLPNFCVSLSRNYLKSFVYSKVELGKWIALREMEEYFLTDGNGRKVKDRRSRSVESKRNENNVRRYIRRKSCEILRDFIYESNI